jgi:hypothetical protein
MVTHAEEEDDGAMAEIGKVMSPPARFSQRNFTLAYSPEDGVALLHGVWRHREHFWIVRYDSSKPNLHLPTFDSLSQALLMAREISNIALACRELFEPARGVKLFSDRDPRWVKRRHRRKRLEFLDIRSSVRPSKRFTAAMRRLQSGDSKQ